MPGVVELESTIVRRAIRIVVDDGMGLQMSAPNREETPPVAALRSWAPTKPEVCDRHRRAISIPGHDTRMPDAVG